jgi:hypothetical protein
VYIPLNSWRVNGYLLASKSSRDRSSITNPEGDEHAPHLFTINKSAKDKTAKALGVDPSGLIDEK